MKRQRGAVLRMPKIQPVVSIIVPAYNAEDVVAKTIDSVLAQSFPEWELIVVNDCSTDNTAAIVAQYSLRDARIKLLNLEKNMGAPAGPRNAGVRLAEGQYVAFLDADDIWHSDKLRLQVKLLETTGARFCSTQMVDFYGNDHPGVNDKNAQKFSWISFRRQLFKYSTPTSSVIACRDLLLENPFNESLLYKAREDLDCWLHCHESIGSSVKIMSPLVGYRILDGQISGNKWIMIKRHFYVLRKYKLKSGRILSRPEALFFTLSHFFFALLFSIRKIRI